MERAEVVIVGAGLAGLSCARRLADRNIRPLVLEGSDLPGGRARTDRVDGFLLDRGFQVLLTAYPETRELLDYPSLELRTFEPGALARYGDRFHRVSDPWRRPLRAPAMLVSPIGSLADKLRVAALRRRLRSAPLDDILSREQTTTLDYLRRHRFSDSMIERFFRPFLGGIFLESDLATSSLVFEFVFRMFAEGKAALPAQGMGELAAQLAATLPAGTLRTGARVARVEEGVVTLASGERIGCEAVVVAAEGAAARDLLGELDLREGPGVTCLYFDADEPPVAEAILVLNGTGAGPVNNLCVPSQVAPSYAPKGRSLVSVSVLGSPPRPDEALEADVRDQLTGWFGPAVAGWRHLRTYRIFHALPDQSPASLMPAARPVRYRSRILVCGDHRETGSLQGALVSGRRAAAAVAEMLGRA